MKKSQVKTSVLGSILDQIQAEPDQEKVRAMCLERIKASRVNVEDKTKMVQILTNVAQRKLQFCIYDLILKYEGNGVIK